MFHLYSSTEAYRLLPLRQALERIAGDGFEGAEIWVDHMWRSDMPAGDVRRLAEALSLGLTAHAVHRDINLTSANAGIRAESLKQVVESLQVAREMGARVVTVHPGHLSTVKDDPAPDYWDRQIDAFCRISDEAGRYGLTVGAETMEYRPAEFMLTAESMIRLLDAVDHPALGITLDIAHLYTLGDALAYAGDLRKIVNVHISDAAPSKMHLPIGDGAITFMGDTLGHLMTKGYDGALVVEGSFPGVERETSRNNLARMTSLREELGRSTTCA